MRSGRKDGQYPELHKAGKRETLGLESAGDSSYGVTAHPEENQDGDKRLAESARLAPQRACGSTVSNSYSVQRSSNSDY